MASWAGLGALLRVCAALNRLGAITCAQPALALTGFGVPASAAGQRRLVELSGIEPLTSSLRTRRSPN